MRGGSVIINRPREKKYVTRGENGRVYTSNFTHSVH